MASFMIDSLDLDPPKERRRRPPWLPALAALAFALLTAWLGFWQLGRASEKRTLQARYDAQDARRAVVLHSAPADWSPLLYRHVRLTGRFDARQQIYIDNRIYQGRAGYFVVAPLDIGGRTVLVDRGWLPAEADRSIAPSAAPPAGELTLEGRAIPARSRYLELSKHDTQGSVWENLDIDRLRAQYRADLPDVLLLQTSPADDGLVRDWPRPGLGIAHHLGYAAQWFSLTTAIVVLYLYFGIWRRYRHAKT